MNLTNVLTKMAAIVVAVFTVVSCDDDFNSVGSEVIGDVNFEDNEYSAVPIAYSKKFSRVQTSGLPNNLIGVYNDPVYGQSTYNVLAQVLPARFNPTFGNNAVLDSVVISLPYFSELTETNIDEDGVVTNTFQLDSIYGSGDINLSIYQSNYFLRDFDVDQGAEERQIYYSNDIADNFGGSIEGTSIATLNGFKPSNEEIILTTPDGTDADDERDSQSVNPRLRIAFLSTLAATAAQGNTDPPTPREANQPIIDYFTSLFLEKEGSVELSNANNFHNYFRGIYFKATPNTGDGSLVFFDITSANITLHYSFDTDEIDTEDVDDDGETDDFIRGTGDLALNFSNNIVNGIDFDFSNATLNNGSNISDILDNQDEINGEDNLFLKGGEGSYAVIDLFNEYVQVDDNGDFILDENENPIIIENPTEEEKIKTELDFLKSRDWLINEASMKIYINQSEMISGDTEPERIYVFNLDTGGVLIDYQADITANAANPFISVTEHLGPITRDSDERGEFYKIKLTRHLIDVLNEDTDNVKLGVSVSQNVNITDIAQGFTPTNTEDEIIPFSSIISHEGTILYGNGANVPEGKRLKMDIFYTESKSN
ncbi:DUF4270 domain-containing protein [Aquimarina sp. SS2-1]|uniref:DUF4270 domain-containing protein n=1 Tax=Aquimarina besae TaxID=3342247 RepID=UPI00366E89D6